MPTYDLKHVPTGEVDEHFVSIGTMEEMVGSGEYEIVHKGTADLVTHTGNILSNTSGDWRDLLKRVKKGSGRDNSIKTY